jgi:hypothetical protein
MCLALILLEEILNQDWVIQKKPGAFIVQDELLQQWLLFLFSSKICMLELLLLCFVSLLFFSFSIPINMGIEQRYM